MVRVFITNLKREIGTKKEKNLSTRIACRGSRLNYNAIFDTGCIGFQSCIKMQQKMRMQPEKLAAHPYLATSSRV